MVRTVADPRTEMVEAEERRMKAREAAVKSQEAQDAKEGKPVPIKRN